MVALRVMEDGKPDEGGGCGSCSAGGGGGDGAKCGNGLEKVYQSAAVRYGYMKHIGEFTFPGRMKFTCGAKVIVQTRRGVEMGELASVSCTGCDKHLSREQIKEYIRTSGADSFVLDNGRILREATVDDLAEEVAFRAKTTPMRRFAQQRANAQGLDLKVVDCEYLFGGDRVIFYFRAEKRVDFRNLVKELAQESQTRVKMHQVGARDEARLVADFETCGREVCCKTFLKTLKPVTMRMAKLQRSTLDPTKVSGRCGRLKCCLRYEHESYESLDVKLPRVREKIETVHGFGTVVNRQVLTQLVQILPVGGGALVSVVVEDVTQRRLTELPAAPPPPPPPHPRRSSGSGERRAGPPRSSKGQVQRRRVPTSKPEGDKAGSPKPPKQPVPVPGPDTVIDASDSEGERPAKRRRSRRRRRRPGGRGGKGGGQSSGGGNPSGGGSGDGTGTPPPKSS